MEKQLNNPMKPAIFLDRDGVLTIEKGYICSVKHLEIFPYAAECIKEIKRKGYIAIVITNQSGVARGLFTEIELIKMNQYLIEHTGVDAVYYCPHHESGIVKQYTISCTCRKPQIGMLEEACRDFTIDLKNSYFVGDRASDIETGIHAGIHTVLLESGYGSNNLEKQIKPDYVFEDLKKFVEVL